MSPIEELVKIIQNSNSKYSHVPFDTSYFRSIGQKLEDCFTKLQPEHIQAELFTVYLTLEHILTVLTGDVRYHEKSVKLVQDVFISIGDLLVALENLIQGNDSTKEQFDMAYSMTVKTYFEKVQQINELLKIKA